MILVSHSTCCFLVRSGISEIQWVLQLQFAKQNDFLSGSTLVMDPLCRWFVARGLLRRTATRRSRHDEGWFRCVSGCPNNKPHGFRGTQLWDKAIEDVWRANGTLEIWPLCFSSHQVFVSGLGHSQPFHLFAKRVIITVVLIHVLWISAPVLNRLCQNTHEGACCNFSPIWSPLGQVKPSPVWTWATVFLHWNHWACCSTL